jgi:hypothetical protein
MKRSSSRRLKRTRLPILTGLSLLSPTSLQTVLALTPNIPLAAFAPTNS